MRNEVTQSISSTIEFSKIFAMSSFFPQYKLLANEAENRLENIEEEECNFLDAHIPTKGIESKTNALSRLVLYPLTAFLLSSRAKQTKKIPTTGLLQS